MKKLVCEICEGTEFKKINGNFVCQQCGCSYSNENIKDLLIEFPEDIQDVQPDVESTISELIMLASENYDATDYDSCIRNCNKILEIDPSNLFAYSLVSFAKCRYATVDNFMEISNYLNNIGTSLLTKLINYGFDFQEKKIILNYFFSQMYAITNELLYLSNYYSTLEYKAKRPSGLISIVAANVSTKEANIERMQGIVVGIIDCLTILEEYCDQTDLDIIDLEISICDYLLEINDKAEWNLFSIEKYKIKKEEIMSRKKVSKDSEEYITLKARFDEINKLLEAKRKEKEGVPEYKEYMLIKNRYDTKVEEKNKTSVFKRGALIAELKVLFDELNKAEVKMNAVIAEIDADIEVLNSELEEINFRIS